MNQHALRQFEEFLVSIPLEKYREELLTVKTVEQDLPRDLNPLPAIYEAYWRPEQQALSLPSYEEFFERWWKSHLTPLDDFIGKYFWGCSRDFVRLGFKARLYRTLISVLTQFHFSYAWIAHCQLSLTATAEADMDGVDALIYHDDFAVALQIKKETYRSEARGVGRFARRKQQVVLTVEVPYTITRPEEWHRRAQRAKREDTREQYEAFDFLAAHLQRWLPNGFVVFSEEYPKLVERAIIIWAQDGRQGTVGWDELLRQVRAWVSLQ